MSERKDEEMVEQGSVSGSSGSSGSEQMVELKESPLHEEEEEHGNHSGNSDSSKVLSDEGDKNAESTEEAQLNLGDVPAPTLIVNESNVSVVQTTEAAAAVGGDSEGRLQVNGDGNCEESNKVEESNHVEELKDEASEGIKDNVNVVVDDSMNVAGDCAVPVGNGVKEATPVKQETPTMSYAANTQGFNYSYPSTLHMSEEDDGTEEEQIAFLREVETFCRERSLDFKHPKFYGEGLNCLKLWRAVTRLGGYDRVTACKLWRQVGESFHPPKTCTTVSWSFRIFYEKALLDYERHKLRGGEFVMPPSSHPEAPSTETLVSGQQGSGGRQRRDAAARAMEGWHFRLHGNGEDKNSLSAPKREKQVKSVGGLLKRKKPSSIDRSVKAARTVTKVSKPQIDTDVIDVGTPAADWVKINVLRTKDCFEVYALVPGLLREEVRVQSDPVGRLVISGDPEQPDNPWGVTPFKKVITLPSRIDPHQTSAVVTLHGQLFVRVPFEQNDL